MATLLLSFLMIDGLSNIELNQNLNTFENEHVDLLKDTGLSSDNVFTGIGAPWNVTHYANTSKQDLDIAFYNNSFDASNEIDLDNGWTGHQLNSTITDLYATRNLINGTFHCGNFTGDGPVGSDDSAYVSDWTFYEYDTDINNPMSGNYYDVDSSYSDGADCLELRIFGYAANNYNPGDKCSWNATFDRPEGEITEARLSLDVNPRFTGQSSGYFTLRVRINNKVAMARNLYAMYERNGGAYWNLEKEEINNLAYYFPTSGKGSTEVKISVEFTETGDDLSNDADSYGLLFDNVTLVVKTKSNPTDIELELNGEPVNDGAVQGEGHLGIIGNWDGSVQSSVVANFSSDYVWLYAFEDEGNVISYKVEFTADLALSATKSTPESYYLVDPDLDYQGSAFSVSNNSDVSWTTYAHMEIPSGYEETNLTVEYPSDYDLTGVYFSQGPNNLSQTTIKEIGNKKIVNIPVSSITSNTNGFWKLTAESPNYCEEMNIYNDATGDWEISDQFLSGDSLNVTVKISNPALISGYIQQTKAKLQIRFPNGTIWSEQNQLKLVDSIGMVYFDPILIPDSKPNYEVGEYQAIVTWNNSYSNFGFNETGIIYKTFTVIHDSYLVADDDFFENIYEGDVIILRVSFSDVIDGKAIRYANVTTTNFMDEVEQFSETSPGYYILEFNTSGGIAGNNYLDIIAEHPLYEDNQIEITIELIFETDLTAEEYPSLEVAWNTNFTIHLNYTYTASGTGIENADVTVVWNGDFSSISGNGLYNFTFNSSRCEVNKIYNLKLTFEKTGCESQTIIVSIEVELREASIASILINDRDCTANKSYNIRTGDLLDFEVTFNDLEASGAFIKGALVTLNKSTEIGEIFQENPTYYNFTLNSIDLGMGTSFVNIIAKKDNYTSVTILLTINVFERDTEYHVYFNGIDYTESPQISMYTNQLLTINVTYLDSSTTGFISGAIVDINGSGVSEVLEESYGNYSVTLNTADLNFGANFLTIYARKDNYEPQSISLVIQIIQIETELVLFLDGEDKSSNPAITRYTDQLLIINVTYREAISQALVSEATVDINGSGISEVLQESAVNYSIAINTADLNFGANFLTIYARKNGFEPQSIVITVQIVQIETELLLFLDGVDKTSNPAITRYTDQILIINVTYKEAISQALVSEATVDINGSGISENLLESTVNYSIVINTADLNFGANFLTIYARKNGFEPQSIVITVQIVQIETELFLFLDGEDMTLNPAITRYTDQILVINVTYREAISQALVSEATVDINGSGISEVLQESTVNYSIAINTGDLNFGANFLTIYARKNGFEPQSIIITVQIVQIETELFLFLDGVDMTSSPAITRYTDQILVINVTYREAISQALVSEATVDINGSGISENLLESTVNYSIVINTGDLNFGANFLTVYARKNGFEPQSIIITVQIVQIETELVLFLNGENKTLNPVITLYTSQLLEINVTYRELISKLLVGGAIVDINGSGISKVLLESTVNYSLVINTADLNIGANFLTIYARKNGFEPQSIIITVQIILIETELVLYLDGEETTDPAIELYNNRLLTIDVTYREFFSQLFVDGAIVDINSSSISEVLEEGSGNYSITLNTTDLSFGANFLTIYAQKYGFVHQSIVITIQIVLIETEWVLYLDGDDKTSNPQITTYINQFLVINVTYKEVISQDFISGAIVDINGSGISELLEEGAENYFISLNTTELTFGANFLTIYARKYGFEPQSIVFTVQIDLIETELVLYLNDEDKSSDPLITTYIDRSLSIDVTYREFTSQVFVSGAIVDINGSDVSEVLGEGSGNYSITLNTNDLNFGANFLTIYARKTGFEPQSIIITIQIILIETELVLYLNDEDKSSDPLITMYTSQLLSIDVTYREFTSQVFVDGAIVDINGSGISEVLGEGSGNYSITLNTDDLNFGANFLTIYARKTGFEPQSIIITVQIVQIETELVLYLNDEDKTSNPAITMYANQLLTIDVTYKEFIAQVFVSGAIVDINGSGISEVLGEGSGNYSITLNTNDLNFGPNFLTIYARRVGYEPQSIPLTIQIIQIETELVLYLDGVDITSNPAITRYPNQLLYIDVTYREYISQAFISGATVDINGSGVSEVLGEGSGNYSIALSTNDLNFGANFLTIYARVFGFEPQSIPLTIQIIQIETELVLYLDGEDMTSNPAITLYGNYLLSIDVTYKENISGVFVSGATVDISGSDLSEILLEGSGNYSITLNTSDLIYGANFLTIYARKNGFEPLTLSLTIQIVSIGSEMEIFINGDEIPSTLSLGIPIGELLNITIKYRDLVSDLYIQYATVTLSRTGSELTLEEDLANHQYEITIDSKSLDLGIKFLTILAEKDYYLSLTTTIKIDVQMIPGDISTLDNVTVIRTQPGKSVTLRIILRDMVNDELILGANVSYTSAIGQADLLDPDGDGIYVVTIKNIPEGTHTLTIMVFAGDDYDFERFRIVISAVRPPEEVLLFQLLTIIGVGATIGVTGYLIAYQKVLKYPKQVRKIRKYRSKVKKKSPLDVEISTRDELINKHYSDEIEALEKHVKKKLGPKAEYPKTGTGEPEKLNNLDSNTAEK